MAAKCLRSRIHETRSGLVAKVYQLDGFCPSSGTHPIIAALAILGIFRRLRQGFSTT
jgi:hypothetical protein